MMPCVSLMKPAAAISTVVIAVLATVVIEETRIKQLQAEVTRLRELPVHNASPAPPEEESSPEQAKTTGPSPQTPLEPAREPEPDPAPLAAPAPAGRRQVPVDYPEPEKEKIQQLAQGPYAQLHLELGLTNREAAYLEEVLLAHGLKMRELAAKWMTGLPDDRPLLEAAMDEADSETRQRIRNFLANEEDFANFTAYREKQPEREMLGQMLPILDQQGVVLTIEEEQGLVDALFQARKAIDGIDWNSPTAIKVIAAGDAVGRFEQEWSKIGETLPSELADVLEPAGIEAVLAAREEVKAPRLESLKAAADALGGTNR